MTFLIYAAIGACLCFVPATSILGYEFAWGVVLFSTLLGAWLTRRESFTRMVAAWLVPLALGLINSLRVRNCNLTLGIEWYLVLALPQLALGWLAASRLRTSYYYMLAGLCAARILLALYSGPSLRFFDPLWGFFAGSIYDEALPIPHPLMWHQLMVMCICVALALRRFRYAVPALILFALGTRLDFRPSRAHLLATLSEVTVTAHVIIHYAPMGAAARAMPYLWQEIERRAEQVAHKLEVEPARATHLYLYDNADDKERLMGARHTLFTRPWVPEIHYLYSRDLGALEHELVHCFAREWNSSLLHIPMRFGVLPHMATVEGLAVALTEPAPHLAMASLAQLKQAPDIAALFAPLGFYQDSGERAYAAAGSYVAWLFATKHDVRSAYATGGLHPEDLVAYLDFLKAQPIDPYTQRYYAEQLRERPLYARVCGREQAERLARAQAALNGEHYPQAQALCAEVLKDDPHDISAVLIGLDAEHRAGTVGYAVHARAVLARTDLPLYAQLHLHESLGSPPDLAAAAAIAVRPDDARRLKVRLALVARPDGTALSRAIDSDVAPNAALSVLADAFHAAPFDPLVSYLYARRLASTGDEAGALAHLPLDPPDFLAFETQRLRVEWLTDLREREGLSEQAHRLTERAQTPSEVALAAAVSERANFYLRHRTW